MDIHDHAGEPRRAMVVSRDWLANVSRRKLMGDRVLLETYDRFTSERPGIVEELGFSAGPLPYLDYENIVMTWLLNGEKE